MISDDIVHGRKPERFSEWVAGSNAAAYSINGPGLQERQMLG